MSQFGRFKKLKIPASRTVEYELYIPGSDDAPILNVRPATQRNKKYFDALLKGNKTLQRQFKSGVSTDLLDCTRKLNRELYPKHVIKGWSGVFDDDGQEVPFSVEACTEFLQMLPDDMFDELTNFCADSANFRDGFDETPRDDLEETAKN